MDGAVKIMANFEGPYFDDLSVGDVFDDAPAMTLTPGRAALHQSILGSRLRLSLDESLSQRVASRPLADPSFVWDVAIGQSTLVTRRVIANLFYRGLVLHRLPSIGDTLSTRTEVVGLKQTRSRPAGLAALRITTVDQEGRLILDFWRCAMLPLSDDQVQTGYDDDLSDIGPSDGATVDPEIVAGWDLSEFPASATRLEQGAQWQLEAGDLVSNATELVRLTLNLAYVHHDRFRQPGGRLVYGGHTIGIALAQLTRTLPALVTITGWKSCDHLGPVREGDTLVSTISVQDVTPLADGLVAADLRIQVQARREAPAADESVLDWRLTAISR
jgi:acyl dehydratase